MDFSFSEDQELMIDSIKEFAATYFTDEAVKEMYEVHHGVPDEVQDAYRDLGFAFMDLREEVGRHSCYAHRSWHPHRNALSCDWLHDPVHDRYARCV